MNSACRRLLRAVLVFGAVAGLPAARAAAIETVDQALCRIVEDAARAAGLPGAFLVRTIWRESSFRSGVVSRAGAQGIAQFMPGTSAERGLADPFDPEQAIPKAAHFLAELKARFGNLGLAAAAYNAGPGRVAAWLRGETDLPAETRAYVLAVTQLGVDGWVAAEAAKAAAAAGATAQPSCADLTADLRRGEADTVVGGPLMPWGVQLAGNFSKALALAAFERARGRYARVLGEAEPMIIGRLLRSRGTKRFYQIRVPAASRGAAEALCSRLRAVGGSCVALRS